MPKGAGPTHRLPGPEALPVPEGVPTLRGEVNGAGLALGIVCSRYNAEVTGRLLTSALHRAAELGVASADLTVAIVPGAFELALAAQALADGSAGVGVHAIVCLGAVIRGETGHYDLVAGEAAAGCSRVQLDTGVPVAFGVLTTDSLEQALARSGGKRGDKGAEAVETAVEMARLLARIDDRLPVGGGPLARAR